jgi:hypothetical protein
MTKIEVVLNGTIRPELHDAVALALQTAARECLLDYHINHLEGLQKLPKNSIILKQVEIWTILEQITKDSVTVKEIT